MNGMKFKYNVPTADGSLQNARRNCAYIVYMNGMAG